MLKSIKYLAFFLLILGFVVIISPLLPTKKHFSTFIVPTGSMKPTIPIGSVVITVPVKTNDLKIGDVIAFESPYKKKDTILHRIHSIKSSDPIYFETKGDNNATPDTWEVHEASVLGKFRFVVPYIGYPGIYMRTPYGFVALVVIPALFFIFLQIMDIKKAFHDEIEKRVENRVSENKFNQRETIKHIQHFSLFLPLILSVGFIVTPIAFSLFSDYAEIINIKLSTGVWFGRKDITINEIMWTGSSAHHEDEWIELKNNTDRDINLKDWKIERAGPDGHSIELEKTIKAGSYLLITHYAPDDPKSALKGTRLDEEDYLVNDKLDLKDIGEKLVLKSPDGETIDETPDVPKDNKDQEKRWVAGVLGSNGSKNPGWHSMERDLEKDGKIGDGDKPESWHTCYDDRCNSSDYWDEEEKDNWGTPLDENTEKKDAPEDEDKKDKKEPEVNNVLQDEQVLSPPEPTSTPPPTPEPTIIEIPTSVITEDSENAPSQTQTE